MKIPVHKPLVRRIWLFITIFLSCNYFNAYGFEVDGLFYTILSDNQVGIVFNRNYQFYSGNLVIPENVNYNGKEYVVVSIENEAFIYCSNFTGPLTIPNTVKEIGSSAFADCSGFSGQLKIPNSVTYIGGAAFNGCSGFSGPLTIPSSVTYIGQYAFTGCSGFSGALTIPSSVNYIGSSAFWKCNGLTSVQISDVTAWCKIQFGEENVSPHGNPLLNIPHLFVNGEEVINLVIPDGVTSISRGAFENLTSLESVIIPNSVTSIGENSFSVCPNLSLVDSRIEKPSEIPLNVFSSISSSAILQVPKGTKKNYQLYTGWYRYFTDIVEKSTNTYNLKITASGNGSASYGGTTVRDRTSSFSVNAGSSATITFSPDNGYRIRSVKVNNSTVSVSNNQYTINSINANTTVSVEFEAIPVTTYTLSITASGNGSASYGGTTVRNRTSSFSVNAGSSATITFSPDNGYRIKSVKVNNTTVSVSNNQYTLSSINANTTVSVEFEAIPITTYTLSITASGNGSASYSGTTVRNRTSSFTVNQGSSATITFSPDNSYRIKSVKVNNTTVSVSNNQYTISSINANTTVSVEFEAIPVTTYTLSITASGNGSASYGGSTIRSKTSSFTVNAGNSATITFSPDNGYRIKSVKVNNTTVSVSNNQYTISSINANTTVNVEFETITYTLSITASGNGSASYGGTTVRNRTSSFTVNAGSSATITFSPDNGYRIRSVKVNNTTVSVSNNQYTISSINANTTVSVEFEAIPVTTYTLSITASGNGSASYGGTTVRNRTSSFSVNAGTSATITFSPDNGYRIKSVKVNNSTVSVSNNQYTINSINANTTVSVEFEAIPVTTYTLSITASGNGSASYGSTTIRGKTSSFSVNAGTSANITFSPDNGYRIKSVKVNNTTVSVSNNQYTISSINANTTVSVEFEAIPVTTYTLSITASGNGSASYGSTTIRGKTISFTVNAGTSANITFSPDNGYRIKSVKVNNTTVSVSNNQYTINSINANTTVSVEFEAIPVTTYTLSITASGNGSVSYSGTSIRNKTSSFSVNQGSSATITFTPDNGYQVKVVKVNGSIVSVSNNEYRISSINQDITMEVEFEAKAPDVDIAKYIVVSSSGGAIMQTNDLVNSGSQLYWTFNNKSMVDVTLKSLQLIDGQTGAEGNKMAVNVVVEADKSVSYSTTIGALGIHVPVTCRFWYEYNGNEYYADATYTGKKNYILTIVASGSGTAQYNGSSIRNQSSAFGVEEKTSVTISFTPDDDCLIKDVKVDGSSVSISNNQYTISSISNNTTVEVEFVEKLNSFESGGVNYNVLSGTENTVRVAMGSYGNVLEVPATVSYQNENWIVTGIEDGALSGNTELAAIIWNPEAEFTEEVSNPNLLLYVTKAQYAPSSIQNVVVNGTAQSIILKDAASSNDFYCPEPFTAQRISYTHNYGMETGIGEAKGWETIALPFDVQKVTHQSKGEIVSFAKWKSGDTKKPFWLMALSGSGWTMAESIKANTPYIISMPNNPEYKSGFLLNGSVTFSAENITVPKSENSTTAKYSDRTFVPTFASVERSNDVLALNVVNDIERVTGGSTEGSRFERNLRVVHPFEAYMTTTSSTRSIGIDEGMATGIIELISALSDEDGVRIYNLNGQLIKIEEGRSMEEVMKNIPAGVYIVNGKKIIIR